MSEKRVLLVDTNSIIEAHRVGDVIDEAALRSQLSSVHKVSVAQMVRIDMADGPSLDEGEKALWAHALGREDVWILCGPDKASMRFGFEAGLVDRLICLGQLLAEIKVAPRLQLQSHHEAKWLQQFLTDLKLGNLR